MPAQDEQRDRGEVEGKRRRRSMGAGEKDETAEGKRAKKSESRGWLTPGLPTHPPAPARGAGAGPLRDAAYKRGACSARGRRRQLSARALFPRHVRGLSGSSAVLTSHGPASPRRSRRLAGRRGGSSRVGPAHARIPASADQVTAEEADIAG